MEYGMVSHSMMIHEKSTLHEVDHHENVVFLVILQNLEKLIDVDTGDSVVSTSLVAAATRTRETTLVGTNDPYHIYLMDYKVVEEYGLEGVLNWLL
ncbi:hypothetical protein Tco_1009308 [Tanacetum coccineum]